MARFRLRWRLLLRRAPSAAVSLLRPRTPSPSLSKSIGAVPSSDVISGWVGNDSEPTVQV